MQCDGEVTIDLTKEYQKPSKTPTAGYEINFVDIHVQSLSRHRAKFRCRSTSTTHNITNFPYICSNTAPSSQTTETVIRPVDPVTRLVNSRRCNLETDDTMLSVLEVKLTVGDLYTALHPRQERLISPGDKPKGFRAGWLTDTVL